VYFSLLGFQQGNFTDDMELFGGSCLFFRTNFLKLKNDQNPKTPCLFLFFPGKSASAKKQESSSFDFLKHFKAADCYNLHFNDIYK